MGVFCDAPEALQAHASKQVRDGEMSRFDLVNVERQGGKFLGWN